MNAIEYCAGPKKLTKTYNKGFPNHSTLINYVPMVNNQQKSTKK